MYKAPAERMTVSLRRKEAEATGKPLYRSYSEIPKGLLSATGEQHPIQNHDNLRNPHLLPLLSSGIRRDSIFSRTSLSTTRA